MGFVNMQLGGPLGNVFTNNSLQSSPCKFRFVFLVANYYWPITGNKFVHHVLLFRKTFTED